MMSDSDFWRDLAQQFSQIDDPMGILQAHWSISAKRGEPIPSVADFVIKCGKFTALRAKFEAVARRGGIKIAPTPKPLEGWLEELRRRGINSDNEGGTMESAFGTILNLRQASEELCHILESIELEAQSADAVRVSAAERRVLEVEFSAPPEESLEAHRTIQPPASEQPSIGRRRLDAMVNAHIRADAELAYEKRKKELDVGSKPIGLPRLISFRSALDGHAELLRELVSKEPNYVVERLFWATIRATADEVSTQLGGQTIELSFSERPTIMQAQILRVRARVQDRIHLLETDREATPVSGTTSNPVQETTVIKSLEGPSAKSNNSEPTCAQLGRLREEAHIGVEELAEAIKTEPRSVYRHLSGDTLPQPKYLAAYERVFSERLGRKVHIKKMSGKCQ